MGMLKTVAQAWKIAEIRSKMIFTLLMLVVFRIGSNIPVPNINREAQEMQDCSIYSTCSPVAPSVTSRYLL
mgnify:CR=1 FL=1